MRIVGPVTRVKKHPQIRKGTGLKETLSKWFHLIFGNVDSKMKKQKKKVILCMSHFCKYDLKKKTIEENHFPLP